MPVVTALAYWTGLLVIGLTVWLLHVHHRGGSPWWQRVEVGAPVYVALTLIGMSVADGSAEWLGAVVLATNLLTLANLLRVLVHTSRRTADKRLLAASR